MFLIEWFLAGVWLVWTILVMARKWPTVVEYLGSYNVQIRLMPEAIAIAIGLALLVGVLGLLIALAVATDSAILPNKILALKSVFVGVRVQALALGMLLGFFAFQNQIHLAHISRQLGKAIIGDKESTAWVLQSAVALVVILVVVFAVRPDFFDYLRTLKVGGFEATFAERSSIAVREASLHLIDLKEDLTLVEYKDFGEKFLAPDSARGQARKLFDGSKVEGESGEIARKLFATYIDPIIISLTCLNKKRALATAAHDYDLITYSAAWEHFLLALHKGNATFSQEEIRPFLEKLRDLSWSVARKANKIHPECMKEEADKTAGRAADKAADKILKVVLQHEDPEDREVISLKQQASAEVDDMVQSYKRAADILRKEGRDKPEIFALTIVEPYLVGAAADLIALVSGSQLAGAQRKAEFLTKMLDQFPRADELVTPGIVNIFYQIADARLSNPVSWPLDQTISDLDYAIRGADILKSRSAQLLADHPKEPNPGGDIFDIFARNELVTLTVKLQLFNQRALANEALPEAFRQAWILALSRELALLKTRAKAPMVLSDIVPSTTLDQTTIARLPVAKIEEDIILEADLAIALSIILVEGSRSKTSALACNTALFYINDAREKARRLVEEFALDRAQETRWKQIVSITGQRVADSCDWRDDRG
jgi:hypothetical protein